MVSKIQFIAQLQPYPGWPYGNGTVKSYGHSILLCRNSTEFTECVDRDVRLSSL